MPENNRLIQEELIQMGYQPTEFNSPQGTAVAFPYIIETGSHAGRQVMLAISAPDGQYPEYPPHWLHISPPIEDGKNGSQNRYTDHQGNHWLAMSRPPADIWDALPDKNMRSYIKEHVRRIWKDV